jgi:3-oxoadipate enol-lactonase
MSNFSYQGKQIFYAVDGTVGKPLLILNGIMMSTRSWTAFVPSLCAANRFIRLDFFDQGQTDKLPGQTYTQELQVDLVKALLDHLGIAKINLVGISYGGEVALRVALKYPNLVDRLVLFNTSPYTSPWLKEIGRGWIAAGKTRDGLAYYQTAIPVIYSPHYYESRLDWMERRKITLIPVFSNPDFLDAMERLTISAESYDVRKELAFVKAKTLIVTAEEDYLTPIDNQKYLYEKIQGSEWIKIPVSGHASMYERPLLFTTLILGFVNVLDTDYVI